MSAIDEVRGCLPGARAPRALWVQAAIAVTVAGCAAPVLQEPPPGPSRAPVDEARVEGIADKPRITGRVLGRSERLLIYQPGPADQLSAIARQFLGNSDLAWTIAEANGGTKVEPGTPLLVPLQPLNPTGVTAERVQTIPILCYHRFGAGGSKMVISPTRFASQLDWLARNGYQVVRLSALTDFLAGQRPLPQRSVVITIDDGYESVHRHAFPLLRQHGFPATLFVYSDFIGAGDALRWPQLQEMLSSGLIDVQSHSKTHRNLIDRAIGETDERYRANLDAEMAVPRDTLQRRLENTKVRHLAYPYGDANAVVIESATRHGYELGLTVVPGANPFYSHPMLLRRTMIFGDLELEGFKARVQTHRSLP